MTIYAQPIKTKIELCGVAIGRRARYLQRLTDSTCPLERMALTDKIEAETFVMLATSWYNMENTECGWVDRHKFLAGYSLSTTERERAGLGLIS